MSGKTMGHNGTQRQVIATGYDKNFALLMEQALEDEGHKIHFLPVGSVSGAVAILRHHYPVAVVTEYNSKRHGTIGPGIAAEVRGHFKDVPVYLLTKRALPKPFDEESEKYRDLFEVLAVPEKDATLFDGVYHMNSETFVEGSEFLRALRKY